MGFKVNGRCKKKSKKGPTNLLIFWTERAILKKTSRRFFRFSYLSICKLITLSTKFKNL